MLSDRWSTQTHLLIDAQAFLFPRSEWAPESVVMFARGSRSNGTFGEPEEIAAHNKIRIVHAVGPGLAGDR